MKKNESAFIFLIIIGFILKLSLLSIGHWIMLIGIGLLANSYFFGLGSILKDESYQEFTENRNKASKPLYLLLPSYSLVIILVGTLFKIMTWPGADLILLSGLVLLLVSLYFVFNKSQEDNSWKRGVTKRLIIYGMIGGLMYSLPSFFWFDIIYRENPDYIEATKAFYADPESESKRILMEAEYQKMNNGV